MVSNYHRIRSEWELEHTFHMKTKHSKHFLAKESLTDFLVSLVEPNKPHIISYN
ncbi:uncharacterized protein DS421_13g434750 [Arachis hypogaea]|nr:uncharacterized protein DS421_13g434750 [Arachis hypogaea]